MAEIGLKNLRDAELASLFKDSENEKTYRRTYVEGNVAPSGLRNGLLISNEVITDVATAMPLIPQTDRNSMILHNTSEVFTVYVGNSDVTASGAKAGWWLVPNGYLAFDITDSILLYGICETGASVNLKIMELS